MKTEFLKPKLDGGRFVEHTLPLEVARDLAAYETLLIELAKHLFMSQNPNRQRVPKGFGTNFHLHLESVSKGSTITNLVIMTAALTLPLGVGAETYYEQSRDLIAKCIAAKPGELPKEFPPSLLDHFNQIGRSLQPDESMTLGQNAVLTPQRRRELVLETANTYEQDVELFGSIGEVNWDNSSFRLRLEDGSQSTNMPMSLEFHDEARVYGGRPRVGLTVQAVGVYNSQDKLSKYLKAEVVDIQPNYQLAARLESVATLEDGWYDGIGVAADKEKLFVVAEKFIENYSENVDLPFVTLTQEGNLLFEWDNERMPSIDLNLASMNAEFHAFSDDGDVERDFSLESDGDWDELFSFLEKQLEVDAI